MTRCAAIRPILPRMIRRETGPEETLEARRHISRNRVVALSLELFYLLHHAFGVRLEVGFDVGLCAGIKLCIGTELTGFF